MKILILDDDPFLLKMLPIQLRNFGLKGLGFGELICFEHAQPALELVHGEPDAIGLIFCDLQLPDVDGLAFVRQLGACGYQGALILVSGKGSRILASASELCRSLGLRLLAALEKPVGPETLGQVLQQFDPDMSALDALSDQGVSPAHIRKALRDGELDVHFQPRVRTSNGEVAGFEALLRWKRKNGELWLPERFLPNLNDTALRSDIVEHVARRALSLAARFSGGMRPVNVSINLAIGQDALPLNFPERLASHASEFGRACSDLTFELTVPEEPGDWSRELEILTRLRLNRVRLSLDRFGTADATLLHLCRFAVDEIKVDRQLVRAAYQDPTKRTIIDSIARLARELSIDSVAVGVEEMADFELAKQLGFDYAQGFFIGGPMAESSVEHWWNRWRSDNVSDDHACA